MGKYDDSYKRVLTIDRDCIGDLIGTLDTDAMDKIVDLLCTVKKNSKKVITAGCGTSGIAAEKIAHILSAVEVPAFFLSPATSIHGGMGAIQQGDVVVLLSRGGATNEVLGYIPVCKAKGATIIGVTEAPGSPLAVNSDIHFRIVVKQESDPWNLIASGSILAVLAAWDAVIFTIMEQSGLTKEEFYLTHPGGSAGEKLAALQERKCTNRE